MDALKPHETRQFTAVLPDDFPIEALHDVEIVLEFRCGQCGRPQTGRAPVTGGMLAVDCECGAELRLQVGNDPAANPKVKPK